MTPASTSAPTAMSVSPRAGRTPEPARYSVPPSVISGQPDVFQDAFDPRRFPFEERLVFIAEERDGRPVTRLAGFDPLRRGGHCLDQRNHVLALHLVHARRRKHAAPIREFDLDALFLQGGSIDVGQTLVRR